MLKLGIELLVTLFLLHKAFSPFMHEFHKDGFGDQNFKWFVDTHYVLEEADIGKTFFIVTGIAIYVTLIVVAISAILFR